MNRQTPSTSAKRLAIEGGQPVRTTPFPPWPSYSRDERDAVTEVLASGEVNYWTGDQGHRFEDEFAAYSGVAHAVALANGTLALEAALRALGIGPGDEVIVPPKTFIASAAAVVTCGATPVFADVDPLSQCIDPVRIEDCVTDRTRAVIPVHLAGWPCDMDAIAAVARRHGLAVIEDCAQAHGARYRDRPVGSFGDVAAFSFCQDKIMSTGGEGGILLTRDEALWRAVWAYKDHGKSYAATYESEPDPKAVYRWLHESFGSNWRLTEMQSAIGRLQLAKLDDWVAQRRRNAEAFERGIDDCPGIGVPEVPPHVMHARYKLYVFVEPERLAYGWDRDRVLHAVNAEGVPCFSGSCSEIYREKAFVDAGLAPGRPLPVAHRLSQTSLMFLCHPTLGEQEMQQMAEALQKVMAVAAVD